MKLTQAWTAASSVWVRSMEAAMLPVVWAALMFCTQATRAPASSAVCTADRPDSPAPTTTTSYSWVSAKSVMGSCGARNAGPVAAPVPARPFSAAASATVLGCPQPASVLAPATPSAARPPNLNRSRRVTVVVMVNSLSFRCAGRLSCALVPLLAPGAPSRPALCRAPRALLDRCRPGNHDRGLHRRSRTRAAFQLPPEYGTSRQPSTCVRARHPVTIPTMDAAAPSRIGKRARKRLFS